MSPWDKSGSHCSFQFIDQAELVLDEMFMSAQSAYAVFAVKHLLKSTIDASHFLYYSSLIPVYQFLSQHCVALSFLYGGYLHLSLQVCFCVYFFDRCCITLVYFFFFALFQFFVFVVLSHRDVCWCQRQKTHPLSLFKQIARILQSCKISQ